MSERDELEADGQPGESRGDDQTTHRRDLLKAVGVGAIGLSGLANATGRVSADQIAIEDWNDLRSLKPGGDNTLVADLDADTPGYEEHVEEPAGGWEPMNESMVTLNGNGHTISDLVIDRPDEDDVGLFGRLETGGIQNLSVRDADITGGSDVGTLIGHGRSCSVVNSDTTGSVSGDILVGGFIGDMENGGEVVDSYTEQEINATGGDAGGLVGWSYLGSVSNSHATGPVDSSGKAGGLVGNTSETSITNSYATGAVSGGDSIGGLVGSFGNGRSISKSFATGAVSGDDGVGGLVGSLGLAAVTNSYATNSVDGEDGVGGLVGSYYNDSYDFTQSYATGPVNGTENVGGLIGKFDFDREPEITDSYWDVAASGQAESAGGTGLGSLDDEPPAEEMIGEDATESMEGFDFADTWETTSSYPILAWQDPSPSVSDYADESGQVTTDGLREAVDDWRAGDIDTELLREVVDAWRSGDGIV